MSGAVRHGPPRLQQRAAGSDDEGRLPELTLLLRTLALLGLLGFALTLPAARPDRAGLVAVILGVGFPYSVAVSLYSRRAGRLPTAVMVPLESLLPPAVVVLFPHSMWTPMLLITLANIGFHAVLFPRRLALVSWLLAAVAFTAVGAAVGPPDWTLGLAMFVCVGPAHVVAVAAVASRHRRARVRLEAMVEGVDAALFEGDPTTHRFTYVSPQIEALTGYPVERWLAPDRFWLERIHPDDLPDCLRVYREALEKRREFRLEFRLVAADGHVLWVHAHVTVERDAAGKPVLLRGVAVDVTDRRRAEESLRYQALHDALTGLPNRAALLDRLRDAIDGAEPGASLALLVMDVDRFREINEALGHGHGDRLLQQLGARLHRALRDGDSVARVGGDEFAVIVAGGDRRRAEAVAGAIATTLAHPFRVGELSVQVRASIGIALYPEQGADAETLLQRADVAMWVAKRGGGGAVVYDPAQDRHSVRRLALVADLRRALERDELELHFQPKLTLRSGDVVGVEALVRWRHPEYGLLTPDRFIGLAEVSGLIHPLTRWVLDRALRQLRSWLNAGWDIGMAVNISARDLQDPSFPDHVAGLLRRWCLGPERLVLEVTENEIMRDRAQAAQTLSRLVGMGVRVSIDDFGTGYSSLADLRQLAIDEIKIDRSFVADMATDVNDAVIVRSIIDLGHNLGLNVVAEGVENAEIRHWLDELGCDEFQGYEVCHPLPASDLTNWLRSSSPVLRNSVSHCSLT